MGPLLLSSLTFPFWKGEHKPQELKWLTLGIQKFGVNEGHTRASWILPQASL